MSIQSNFRDVPHRCVDCAALSHGFCAAISTDRLQEFATLTTEKFLSVGEEVTSKGEIRNIVGNVRSGVLKFAKILPDGREFISQLLFPGDIFCLADGHSQGFALKAATRAEVCVVTHPVFAAMTEADPATRHAVLSAIGEELEDVEDWVVKMGTAPVGERIAFLLLALWSRIARRSSTATEDGNIIVELPVPRRDIAAFLGTSVESLSRQLQHLARTGVIRIVNSRQFTIRSPERLAELAAE